MSCAVPRNSLFLKQLVFQSFFLSQIEIDFENVIFFLVCNATSVVGSNIFKKPYIHYIFSVNFDTSYIISQLVFAALNYNKKCI